MSIRKDLGRSKALRPSAESLETRQLLSATVSGTDTAGDRWTLTLKGKGSLQVVKQNDASGSPAALDSASEISSITVSGTDPNNSVLVGTVKKAAGSDGRVFFNDLTEITNRSQRSLSGLGLLAINMPDFWLGYTGTTTPTANTTVAQINIPDGVNSLRFGGVDTTRFFGTNPAQSPAQDGQTDQFLVRLGLPTQIGTSIVVDRVISSAQAGTTTSGTTANPTQKSVVFNVSGRINLFQANSIEGNTQFPSTSGGFDGGTIVASFSDATSTITGELGFIRIGGNATNFSAVTNNILSNFYVGGETDNVSVLSPNGSRNFYFGKGFDTTTILTHSIENLYANRGALNSSITSERQVGDLMLGGDVANTTVLSGYTAGLGSLAQNVQSNLANPANTSAVTASTPQAQANGMITAFVAGNITNSVFAASVLPFSQLITPTDQTFGNAQDAFLPLGKIIARVEGAINNDSATPDSPKTAFYSKSVDLRKVVVNPPRVVEEPLPAPATPIRLPGIPKVFPATVSTRSSLGSNTNTSGTGTTGAGGGASALSVTKGAATPKAPKVKAKS